MLVKLTEDVIPGSTNQQKLNLRESLSRSYWTKAASDPEFSVSGDNAWNNLPPHVKSAPSLAVFRQRLKTFLFSRSYPNTLI